MMLSLPDFYMDELASYYRIWQKEKELLGDAWEGGENQYFTIAEKENHIITPRQQASGQSFKKNTN